MGMTPEFIGRKLNMTTPQVVNCLYHARWKLRYAIWYGFTEQQLLLKSAKLPCKLENLESHMDKQENWYPESIKPYGPDMELIG